MFSLLYLRELRNHWNHLEETAGVQPGRFLGYPQDIQDPDPTQYQGRLIELYSFLRRRLPAGSLFSIKTSKRTCQDQCVEDKGKKDIKKLLKKHNFFLTLTSSSCTLYCDACYNCIRYYYARRFPALVIKADGNVVNTCINIISVLFPSLELVFVLNQL